MEDELLQHLTNLLRHSRIVTFKIPSFFFSEAGLKTKQHQEIEEAWTYVKNNMDLQIYKVKQDEELITVRVKVKHTKGVL